MRDMTFKSIVYKCPNEGPRCRLGKHCHILETREKLPCKVTAYVKCDVCKKKISVEIGV